MVKRTSLVVVLVGVSLALAACSSYIQTTSGEAYLSRYESQAGAGTEGAMDPAIREAANVEPTLTFPARIGLARIEDGFFTPMPQVEADAWLAMAEDLGADWGEFVPISPLIVALADSGRVEPPDCPWRRVSCRTAAIDWTVRRIRLGAARQHVDAVLLYEVFAKSKRSSNPLAVTKIALVGFFLAPSENIEADGHAQGVLVDVRNGYTYAIVSAVAEDAAFTLSTSVNSDTATLSAEAKAKAAAAVELAKETAPMLRDLRIELAEKRASKTAP